MGDNPAQRWQPPPTALVLSAGEVHLWRASLDAAPEQIAAFAATLAPEERARAERFRRPVDRDHFIVARGLLRAILARYLDREPGAIAFRYGPSGKPALHDDTGNPGIQFNLSHADGMALYAVTRDSAVGVDIERVRAGFADERIAERFFSRHERAALRALPPEQQQDAFFRCWTRKEAYVKARGTGIATALDSFDVSLAPDEPAAILAIREAGAPGPWSLHHLEPGPGYVGAVAVAGEHPARAYRQWQALWEQPGGATGDARIYDLSGNIDAGLASSSCHRSVMGTCQW